MPSLAVVVVHYACFTLLLALDAPEAVTTPVPTANGLGRSPVREGPTN